MMISHQLINTYSVPYYNILVNNYLLSKHFCLSNLNDYLLIIAVALYVTFHFSTYPFYISYLPSIVKVQNLFLNFFIYTYINSFAILDFNLIYLSALILT